MNGGADVGADVKIICTVSTSMAKRNMVGYGLLCVTCTVAIVSVLIALNCLADKNDNCAQYSGFLGLVCSCLASCVLGLFFYVGRHGPAAGTPM